MRFKIGKLDSIEDAGEPRLTDSMHDMASHGCPLTFPERLLGKLYHSSIPWGLHLNNVHDPSCSELQDDLVQLSGKRQ